MAWQDLAMSALLAAGLLGTWRMAFDPRTRLATGVALTKAGASAGLCVLQLSLGLWVTAAVSALYAAAFLTVAARRPASAKAVPA